MQKRQIENRKKVILKLFFVRAKYQNWTTVELTELSFNTKKVTLGVFIPSNFMITITNTVITAEYIDLLQYTGVHNLKDKYKMLIFELKNESWVAK